MKLSKGTIRKLRTNKGGFIIDVRGTAGERVLDFQYFQSIEAAYLHSLNLDNETFNIWYIYQENEGGQSFKYRKATVGLFGDWEGNPYDSRGYLKQEVKDHALQVIRTELKLPDPNEKRMPLVIIESPYAGDVEANVAYARRCMADSLRRGEAPYCSHLLFTQPGILDDTVPAERTLGIAAGLEWGKQADLTAVYIDRGISSGMQQGIDSAKKNRRKVEYRSLDITPNT